MNLYEDCESYSVLSCQNREDWLKARTNGLGGSDASAFMGCGYKTRRDIWYSKKNPTESKPTKAMRYGIQCEPALRELFKAKHPELEVQYQDNTMLVNKDFQWAFYSPDGLLFETETGRKGILEIKTHASKGYVDDLDLWGTQRYQKVPDPYYWQVIHGLAVTDFDFVYVICEIRYEWMGESQIVSRLIDRHDEDVELAIEQLMEAEQVFWEDYFLANKIPPIDICL